MKFRTAGTQFLALLFIGTLWVSPAMAQSNQSSAAKSSSAQANAQGQAQASSKVSTEMVKGKLNPATSKPGDQVVVRTKEDVKSNGQVVLKKGTEITGVVTSVKRAHGKAESKGQAQSMMQIDWLTPAGSGASAQQLNLALQSIAYTNPLYAHQSEESAGSAVARPAPARTGSGGGGLGGVGGAVGGLAGGASSTVGAAGNITGNVGGAVAGTTSAAGNASLLAAPSPIAANSATATALQNNFGVSGNSLFMVGHGSAVSTGGTTSSMDIFTHMSNDAVITSPSKDFEVASGAQMDFMVGAKGQK
jgi:hypothetical protein